MACTRADDRDEFVRFQSSAPQDRLRQASGNGGGKDFARRLTVYLAMDQHTDDLLSLAQEAGNLGIFEWSVQAGAVQVSPKLLVLYGLETFDGRYESWLKCVFREDKPLLVDQTERAFAARIREAKAEFRIKRASDGALKWIESRSIVFYDAQGHAVRVVSVHADVTERRRAIMELR